MGTLALISLKMLRSRDTPASWAMASRWSTELAENLHLQVLAEYVETEEQREMLHKVGCDHYQGYLYSPAVPLDPAAA